MNHKLQTLWEWTRETIQTTRLHHYVVLGMVSLWIVLMKGGNNMHVLTCIGITTLFFVLLLCFVWFCIGITKLVKLLSSKAGKKELQEKLTDLEHFIDDVKDDISNDDMTIQSSADEGLRRMMKLQKDQHVAKLHKLETQRDEVKTKLLSK